MLSDGQSLSEEKDTQETEPEQLNSAEKHALHKYGLKSPNQTKDTSLRLDFKQIKKMDFLYNFTSLVRLDLNNNCIQKILTLDRLINLTWLNLSYNQIENIEGLEPLRKLELLNLSNNKVSVLKNMDTLENLSHFFISKNLIAQKESVLYLRRFKKLFKLSIAGNPFTEQEDSSFYVAAFLPNLTLLDNILICPKMREEASAKYQLEKIQQELQEQQAGFEPNQEAQPEMHKDTFMNNVMKSAFHGKLTDDAEATRPDHLPGSAPALQTADSQVMELCSKIFAIDSAEHKQLETKLNSFFCDQTETKTYYQQRTAQILAEFEEQHTQRRKEIKKLEDPELQKTKINECNGEISQLCESLLTLEFKLVRTLDGNIQLLHSYISDMRLPETMDNTEDQAVTTVSDLKAALINEIQKKEEKRNRARISDIHRYVDYLKTQLEDFEMKG